MEASDVGLPHREPFVFVDEVESVQAGQSAVGRRTFRPDEAFFAGHFPGEPVVPGVLLAEGIAQVAGIAAGSGKPGRRFLLSAIRSMKFLRPVLPDEIVRMDVRLVSEMGGLYQFEGTARIGEETVAEGQVVLSER